MRNALTHVQKGRHTMVAAAIRQAFLQTDADAAHQTWRHVADQLRPRWPKLAALMDDSEHDGLAYIGFPAQQLDYLPQCLGRNLAAHPQPGAACEGDLDRAAASHPLRAARLAWLRRSRPAAW
jgi:hypothetical protein